MLNRLKPVRGQWYRNEQGDVFEVVAIEEEAGIIEIQYFDGAVEELDSDSWYGQMLTASAEPEDCSGAFDDLTSDDLGDTETTRHHDEWSNPLDTLDWEE
jgi:hypothetical protein